MNSCSADVLCGHLPGTLLCAGVTVTVTIDVFELTMTACIALRTVLLPWQEFTPSSVFLHLLVFQFETLTGHMVR